MLVVILINGRIFLRWLKIKGIYWKECKIVLLVEYNYVYI